MKKAPRLAGVLVCVAVLTACGSPSSGTAFKPPSGWNSSPGVFGRFQIWMTGQGSNDRQVLVLVRGDKNMRTEQTFTFGNTGEVQEMHQHPITLCGNQAAQYINARAVHRSGNQRAPEIVEGTITTIGNSKYAALYIRPASMHADAGAEDAIRSVCPQ